MDKNTIDDICPSLVQILPDMIKRSSNLYHNLDTALPTYMGLEAFRKASLSNKVKDISLYTHELRWIKSSSEIKLMKQSAAIACQVCFIISLYNVHVNFLFLW